MERSIWRTFVTISLMIVIGLFVATPPVYGYNYPEMVEWTEEDAAFLFIDNPINLAEMKRALWYKEQFYALADYVEIIEVALEVTMEERDEALEENILLTLLDADRAARIVKLRIRLGTSLGALSVVSVVTAALIVSR